MSYAKSAPYHDPRLSLKSALKFLPKQLGWTMILAIRKEGGGGGGGGGVAG